MTGSVSQKVIDMANAIKGLIIAHYNITGSSSTKGHVQAGGTPQAIGSSLSAGTDNGYYARADHVHTVTSSNVKDTTAYTNLGTNANDSQANINAAINTQMGNIITFFNGTGD